MLGDGVYCSSLPMRPGLRELVIAIVDDAAPVCEALEGLLRSEGFTAQSFACAEDFLASDCGRDAGCLILDVRLPGMSGLQLQQHLAAIGWRIPIVFITAQEDADGQILAQALRAGATACLHKPFGDRELLTVVRSVFPR